MYRRYSGLAEISNAGATDDVPLVALAVKRYFGSAECVATISPCTKNVEMTKNVRHPHASAIAALFPATALDHLLS